MALAIASERDCIFLSCSSTRRTLVRYSSRIALSLAPILLLQALRLLQHGVEHALLRPAAARCAACDVPGSPNMRSNVDLRIHGHRQRALVVAPCHGVEEHARVAVAGACRRAHVFRSDLERAQRGVAGDRVGDVLVDRLLRADQVELTVMCRAGPLPFRNAALAPMWIPPMSFLPSGAFIWLIVVRCSPIRLERLHRPVELPVLAGLLRMPQPWINAVRHVDRAKAQALAPPLCGSAPSPPVPSRRGTAGRSRYP